MKTTFKEVFNNFEDDMMNIDENSICEDVEIDMESVKKDVMSKIQTKHRSKKQFRVIMIAAVLCVVTALGATAVYAAQNFDEIFSEFFGGDMNSAGLYESESVELVCEDESLNVQLLGVTGDDKKIYAAIEVSKKDGSRLFEEEFVDPYNISDPTNFGAVFECEDKDGNAPERCNGKIDYILSDDGKTLKMCVLAMNGDENINLKDGTMHFVSDRFGANEIIEKNVSGDVGELDENCFVDSVDGVDCLLQPKEYSLKFKMDFVLSYETNDIIKKKLTAKDAPDYIIGDETKVNMEITPFGVNLYSQSDSEDCFAVFDYSSEPKVILEDGTEYYLYHYGIDAEGEKDGDYVQEAVFNLSTVSGPPIYGAEVNIINPNNVSKIIINGNTIYEK